MGNCTSQSEEEVGHELLGDEDNDNYFTKIEKRNQVRSRDTAIPPPEELLSKKRSRKARIKEKFGNKLKGLSTNSETSNGSVSLAGGMNRMSSFTSASQDGGAIGGVGSVISGVRDSWTTVGTKPTGAGGNNTITSLRTATGGLSSSATSETSTMMQAKCVALGVRGRTAMLEQAETDAIAGKRQHRHGSAIQTTKAKFSMVISPTGTTTGDGEGESVGSRSIKSKRSEQRPRQRERGGDGIIDEDEDVHLEPHSPARSFTTVSTAASVPLPIPASRKDTATNRNCGGSVVSVSSASSHHHAHLGMAVNSTAVAIHEARMVAEAASASSAANRRARRRGSNESDHRRNVCTTTAVTAAPGLEYTPARPSNGEEEEVFNPASLSEAMIYAEFQRHDRISAISWQPLMDEDEEEHEHTVAIGTDDGLVAIVNVEEQRAIDKFQNDDDVADFMPLGSSHGTHANSPRKKHRTIATRELPPREGRVRTLSWSPNKPNYLCVGGDDCTATVIDTSTLTVIGEVEREDRIYAASYSTDGQYIAIGGFDGMVAIVNSGTMELIAEITNRSNCLVLCLGWNPDGSLLAIGGSDKMASVVDTSNWNVVGEIQRPGSVLCLQWRGGRARQRRRSHEEHEDDYDYNDFHGNEKYGQLLALGGSDGVVAIVDIDSRCVIKDIPLIPEDYSDSPGRQRLRGGGVALPQDRGISSMVTGTDRQVNQVSWNPDGSFLAIAGSHGSALIVETKTFVVVHELVRGRRESGGGGGVTCVDWHEGGGYLAAGGEDRKVAIFKTGGIMSSAAERGDSMGPQTSPSTSSSSSSSSSSSERAGTSTIGSSPGNTTTTSTTATTTTTTTTATGSVRNAAAISPNGRSSSSAASSSSSPDSVDRSAESSTNEGKRQGGRPVGSPSSNGSNNNTTGSVGGGRRRNDFLTTRQEDYDGGVGGVEGNDYGNLVGAVDENDEKNVQMEWTLSNDFNDVVIEDRVGHDHQEEEKTSPASVRQASPPHL